MTLACCVSFAAGAVLFHFLRPVLWDLWVSFFGPTPDCFLASETVADDSDTYGVIYYGRWACVPYDLRARLVAVGIMVVGLGVLGWLAWFLARRVLRPVAGMVGTVRQMGPQNLGQRVRPRGPRDELRRLGDSLDEMLDRVAVGFEGQRRFASNASHELRTPLAVQRTLVEVAMVTGGDDPDLRRLAEALLLVNERNERLIEGLLVLAESDRGLTGTVPLRLDRMVSGVLDSYADLAAEHDVTLRPGLCERTVHGEPVLLERLVSNLVHNAIKYNEPGGTIDVVVAREPALSVHNTGVPVPAESVPALFEPFRRLTAERGSHHDGAGLGLSIVRSICDAHGGVVHASVGERGGLRVEVSLP